MKAPVTDDAKEGGCCGCLVVMLLVFVVLPIFVRVGWAVLNWGFAQ